MLYQLSYEVKSVRNIKHSNRLDLVAQLVEHWTSKPKVAGSIPTVVRLFFQLAWCGIYTQSNNTLQNLNLVNYYDFKTFCVSQCNMSHACAKVLYKHCKDFMFRLGYNRKAYQPKLLLLKNILKRWIER